MAGGGSSSTAPGGAPTKKPKTIHRCILQRVSRNGGKGGAGGAAALKCHVCDSAYVNYERYYAHLMDSTCAKREERIEFRLSNLVQDGAFQIKCFPLKGHQLFHSKMT